MKINNFLKFIISVGGAELAGIIGSVFTAPAIKSGWYAGLARPEIASPNWIFAPVWTALFALMGVAVFLVWKSGFEKRNVKIALIIFDIQLVLNIFWSAIFFGLKNPGWAFVEIIFLWLAILFTIIFFSRISKTSTYLLVPYIVWVSFAGYLNFLIWKVNDLAKIEFEKPEFIGDFSKRGALIFKKDNPSGLPEYDDALEIPVVFK